MDARKSLIVIIVFVAALSCGACAPAYHRVPVPSAAPFTPASWSPAHVGGAAVVTDLSGVRWAGTVEALGDSIVMRAHESPGGRHAFAHDQIASLQYRPKAIGSEKVVPVVFTIALVATGLWLVVMSGLDFN